MNDQASDLRQWVRVQQPRQRARVVALMAGKGGVGTTAAAIALADGLAQSGRRVLLVDADPCGGDLALRLAAETRYTLADVVARRMALGTVRTQWAPGLSLVAGHWGPGGLADCSWQGRELLHHQIRAVDATEVVIVDLGLAVAASAAHLAELADAVLVVVTPDPSAVLAGYAAIKLLHGTAPGRLGVLMNQVRSPAEAEAVHARMERATRRFFAAELPLAGALPRDALLAATAWPRGDRPARRSRSARRALQELARSVWDRLAASPSPEPARQAS